ncbi:hypothetical protein BpHYR1_030075 [Brachionus plicatilis]|uniref:Uncharacterized protein n=1 Tax=Brachionus plicatilis TaxID=10195 RepID=A0A3M7RDC8_BRAPC|nr:hypothetical protein BpHYR1_030075 [Brachionus plicatilis]
MKISVEKSCSVVFSKYKKESDNLNLKIYGNRIKIISKNGPTDICELSSRRYVNLTNFSVFVISAHLLKKNQLLMKLNPKTSIQLKTRDLKITYFFTDELRSR